jgi:uncharacterized protein
MDHSEPDEEDVEALLEAAGEGDLEEVRRLVQQDRRLLNANGVWTPLTAASEQGQVEVIRYLLDEGAQVNLRDRSGDSALDEVCYHGQLEAASLLLAHGADAAAAGDEGDTPLMLASARGHTNVVALLLAHGCGDINRQTTEYGRTAVHSASWNGYVRVVRALLGAEADPHIVDRVGETPLVTAVRLDHEECVAVLEVRSVVIVA